MKLNDIEEQLFLYQEQMELASEDNDWSQLAEINKGVVSLLKVLTKDQQENELAEPIQLLRETYQSILEYSDIRREEIQSEMGKLRKKKTALQGYGQSLAAGNKEVRVSA